MGWAARNLVRPLTVILNTAAFHLQRPRPPRSPVAVPRQFGAFMVRRFNAFSYFATWAACRKAHVRPAQAYCAPYNSRDNRIATLRFVQDIPLKPGDRGYELITGVQDALSQFKEIEMICWGMKDFASTITSWTPGSNTGPKPRSIDSKTAGIISWKMPMKRFLSSCRALSKPTPSCVMEEPRHINIAGYLDELGCPRVIRSPFSSSTQEMVKGEPSISSRASRSSPKARSWLGDSRHWTQTRRSRDFDGGSAWISCLTSRSSKRRGSRLTIRASA